MPAFELLPVRHVRFASPALNARKPNSRPNQPSVFPRSATRASPIRGRPASPALDARKSNSRPNSRGHSTDQHSSKNVVAARTRTRATPRAGKHPYQQATSKPCASIVQRLRLKYFAAPPYSPCLRPTAASTLAAHSRHAYPPHKMTSSRGLELAPFVSQTSNITSRLHASFVILGRNTLILTIFRAHPPTRVKKMSSPQGLEPAPSLHLTSAITSRLHVSLPLQWRSVCLLTTLRAASPA
ncbi:unnamed protein product [Linum trigynum]|uniref:Uncharacterized protein n=1 Tax=Linum trigynum TaxID=586398 RepID=A0AAV2G9C1_9ROSI